MSGFYFAWLVVSSVLHVIYFVSGHEGLLVNALMAAVDLEVRGTARLK